MLLYYTFQGLTLFALAVFFFSPFWSGTNISFLSNFFLLPNVYVMYTQNKKEKEMDGARACAGYDLATHLSRDNIFTINTTPITLLRLLLLLHHQLSMLLMQVILAYPSRICVPRALQLKSLSICLPLHTVVLC